MVIAELLLLQLTGWYHRRYESILEEGVRGCREPDSCVIHQGWFCSVLCRKCRQHWSICRPPHRRYKCLRFLKMTDHYYTGAGATGGLLIWIIAWRWAEIDSSHWLGRHQNDQEHDTAATEGNKMRCGEIDVMERIRLAAKNASETSSFLSFFLLSSRKVFHLCFCWIHFSAYQLLKLWLWHFNTARSSSVGACSTGCRDTKADISVHVLSSWKYHFPEKHTIFPFRLLTEH